MIETKCHETAAEYIARRRRRRVCRMTALIDAAQAVCDRWDNPLLAKDTHHIIALRKAIEQAKS